jgi:hypothetical protein
MSSIIHEILTSNQSLHFPAEINRLYTVADFDVKMPAVGAARGKRCSAKHERTAHSLICPLTPTDPSCSMLLECSRSRPMFKMGPFGFLNRKNRRKR